MGRGWVLEGVSFDDYYGVRIGEDGVVRGFDGEWGMWD